MAAIELRGVRKTYAGGHRGVRDLSLRVADGELVVLVGPSGSGKSTALRLIAGLETPDQGQVLIGGSDVTDVPPQRRDLAMVFQHYALYPHKTVRENLAFSLRMRGVGEDTRRERVEEVARMLRLEDFLDRRPAQLSGGQRQRVALGRALVRQPGAFLLDEPLSNLDPALRLDTRAEIALLHRRLGATMIYVTHDQEEAMTLGDRVAVLGDGALQQVARPDEIYQQPANRFVAQFVGSPPMNLIDEGNDRQMGVRPHDIDVVPAAGADLVARVEVAELVGPSAHLRARTDNGQSIVVTVPADRRVPVGERVGVRLRRDRLHFFSTSTGQRLEPPDPRTPVLKSDA
jgi:ABC-type sugar transport system ATPase subunit